MDDELHVSVRRRRVPPPGAAVNRLAIAAVLAAIPVLVMVLLIRAAVTGPASYNGLTEIQDRAMVVPAFGMTVKQIRGTSVHSIAGEQVGHIESVLRSDGGDVVAATLSLGGIFGIGARHVIVRLDQLRPDGAGFMLEMSEEQAGTLPAWDG